MENFSQLVPIVFIAPMIGLLINLFLGKPLGERGVGLVAVGAALTSFTVAVLCWVSLIVSDYTPMVVSLPFLTQWIHIPAAELFINWQFRVDTLSVTMMLVVSGVGSLIHIYAQGYMHGDPMYPRFFVYLNLFLMFMMLLVTGNNFLVMFVGWEGVGLCSYLLISFWWDKTQKHKKYGTEGWKNSIAGRKAFIANRVGDFGFIVGVILVFWTFGTLDFYKPNELPITVHHETAVSGEQVAAGEETGTAEASTSETAEGEHATGEISPATMGVFNQVEMRMAANEDVHFGPFALPLQTVITLITLFFLLGVTGKSAQIPLFVWLPDAMAGPTPVSALIHAATMVTAGVYLMVRSNVLYHYAPTSSLIVALVGCATALVGGFIALGQWDIKAVLAYSTISQLGFMVAAVGVGAYAAAMFHLVTHAVFKGLLFLGSGVIIHAMEHGHHAAHEHAEHAEHAEHGSGEEEIFDPQDMRNMGGLKDKMPRTFWAYMAGMLALSGVFPFAGFWSKDEILADAIRVGFIDGKLIGYVTFGSLLVAALFTAFYMGRQVLIVFYGEPRTEAAKYAGEKGYGYEVMVRVLMVLGVGALLIGLIGVPRGFWILDRIVPTGMLTHFISPAVPYAHEGTGIMLLAIVAVVGALTALFTAYLLYGKTPVGEDDKDVLEMHEQTADVFALANARLYWDETYDRFIITPFNRFGRWLAERLDWAFWHDFVHERILKNAYNAVARVLGKPVDLGLIDGIVNALGKIMYWVGGRLRGLQTGYVRVYALSIFFGALLVIALLLLPIVRLALGL